MVFLQAPLVTTEVVSTVPNGAYNVYSSSIGHYEKFFIVLQLIYMLDVVKHCIQCQQYQQF